MTNVEKLKSEIEKLPGEEYSELSRWFLETDWKRWDSQIEADAAAGQLDFLIEEALEEKAKGRLRDL